MARPSDLQRYALYGEENRAIAPEFVHVEPISARSPRHHGTIEPHTHPGIFQLLLVERGSARLESDGTTSELLPGTLVVLPSGSVHAFRFSAETEGWVLSIAVDLLPGLRLIDQARPHAVENTGAVALAAPPGSRLTGRLPGLFAAIAADLEGDAGGHPEGTLRAALTLLLATADELLAAHVAPAREDTDRGEDLIRRFRALVDARFRAGWTVARYAAELGTTPPTLTRACRRVLGRSPGGVVHERLLLEAMRALTYTSAPVSRIADELGFADPAYFARFFKERTGVTASLFRRERVWLNGVSGVLAGCFQKENRALSE